MLNNKSIFESIIIGPNSVRTETQAAQEGVTQGKFVMGLLKEAYQFTDDQLKGLANMERSDSGASVFVKNGDIAANYKVEIDNVQRTAKFTVVISGKNMTENMEIFQKIIKESIPKE